MLEISIFSILSIFMLGGAITMISVKQTIFSAFGFLVSMISLAGIFALLDNRFLAIAQLMVLAGGVVVLLMLTILSINMRDENLPKEPNKLKWIIFSSILVSPLTIILYKTLNYKEKVFQDTQIITAKVIGELIFTKWIFTFEIISILLLSAMVGAIVITKTNKKARGLKK